MLTRKPLIIAAIAATTLSVSALSSQAHANGDALLGAVVGAGIGAAIGHDVRGHDGAIVGGAIGAIAGASLAAQSSSYYYYDGGYYAAPSTVYTPAPAYYGVAPAYYQAAPIYNARPWVHYASRANYVRVYSRRDDDRGRYHAHGNSEWHDSAGRRGQ